MTSSSSPRGSSRARRVRRASPRSGRSARPVGCRRRTDVRRRHHRRSVMKTDLLDLYRQASDWTAEKIAATTDLDAATPCDGWSVRNLLDHMLDTQRYFAAAARGEKASPPNPTPPPLSTQDPVADFAKSRSDVLDAFGRPGVIEKTGPVLGIAFSDQLLHGWDLARATKQDTTMPDGLARA